jgi:hypothetical protein
MKKIVMIVVTLVTLSAAAQTNSILNTNGISTLTNTITPLGYLESYLVDNDTNYNGWTNNHFTVFQSAVFSNVKGVPGASTLGNDLGLEVPYHAWNVSFESVTRFEQLFGDVHEQSFGAAYDYNLHQVQLSGGVDLRYTFDGHRVQGVPFVEVKKASTQLQGLSPFARYSYPISGHANAGELEIGLCIKF